MRLVLLAVVLVLLASPAFAQIAISVNDNKVMLDNGTVKVVPNAPPDTLTVIDLKSTPPRVVTEIAVPASVVGPPFSVAITPDEGLALVTAAMKVDPNDPTKQTPDSRLSVVDLRATPPRVIATLDAGKGAAGVSINRQGNLALVANRNEGTISVYSIHGRTVTPAGKVTLGDEKTGVCHAAITPDGKMALVSRDGDERISVLSIEGTKVELTKREISAGLRPYGIDVSSKGDIAVVANVGRGQGDADTASLIDLRANPPRVVDTITVGQTPEGIKLSPDGSLVAIIAMNGSNKPKESPFFNDHGNLVLLRISSGKLSKVAEAPIGHWSQGAAFSPDGRTILVGNMVEKEVWVFEWDGSSLRQRAKLKVNGGSAAVRTADK